MPIHRYASAYQYSETTPVAPSSLLTGLGAYWPMNETSDGSAPVTRLDMLGVSDLTDNNTCPSAVGKISNCVSFDSNNSERLTVAANANLSTVGFSYTLSLWFKIRVKVPAAQVYWNKFDGTIVGSEYSVFWTDTPDLVHFRLFGNSGFNDLDLVTLGAPVLNAWNHLLCWFDLGTTTLNAKANGGATDSMSTGGNISAGNTGTVTMGGLPTAESNIDLDECGFWPRLLTPAEMATLWNGGAGKAYPFT